MGILSFNLGRDTLQGSRPAHTSLGFSSPPIERGTKSIVEPFILFSTCLFIPYIKTTGQCDVLLTIHYPIYEKSYRIKALSKSPAPLHFPVSITAGQNVRQRVVRIPGSMSSYGNKQGNENDIVHSNI